MTAQPGTAPPVTQMKSAAALNAALDEALATDERVFLLGEDTADPGGGMSGGTKGLSTRHGAHRVRATPISEQVRRGGLGGELAALISEIPAPSAGTLRHAAAEDQTYPAGAPLGRIDPPSWSQG